ncbi:hypothetical protein MTsPCn9_13890 [Croceitalea sp. MTPC9]|uniref:DoxX family protein n=1 Tax=unclassified Croceitalea TaxID=2632280 RepID=UPI002B36AD13|nr:hypothetical protein MTsPCn6_15240 [Croceitalea sp. MTPC6]GMN16453.1 hypothetical protein MTsPCn9_13890 [Croceitalea sp. MTPC9]
MGYINTNYFSWYLIGLMTFSAISFIIFGLSCLYSSFMVSEFERYGLKNFRKLNAYLQLVGGVGLVFGFYWKIFGILASAGLAILMILGFMVRLKIRDSFIKSFPAFFYIVVNTTILVLLIM